ncbi:unnamed protein product, partial [Closterium sp. Naga37s-1]
MDEPDDGSDDDALDILAPRAAGVPVSREEFDSMSALVRSLQRENLELKNQVETLRQVPSSSTRPSSDSETPRYLTTQQAVGAAIAVAYKTKLVMDDTLDIIFFCSPNNRVDFWPARCIILGAMELAMGYTTTAQKWNLRHVYRFDLDRRGYIRDRLQAFRHELLTSGWVSVINSFNLRISRPDRRRQVHGSNAISKFLSVFKPEPLQGTAAPNQLLFPHLRLAPALLSAWQSH